MCELSNLKADLHAGHFFPLFLRQQIHIFNERLTLMNISKLVLQTNV